MQQLKIWILRLVGLFWLSSCCFADSYTYTSNLSAMERKLVSFVYNTVENLHYSSYKLGGSHFDTNRGIYVVDCSSYVDNILQKVFPNAYSSLVDSTGTDRPTSQHFYNFFSELAEQPNNYWNKINDVSDLQPGDILVFRSNKTIYSKKHHQRHILGQGHVMVVMNKPIFDTDAFLVQVADSAKSGHSQDTRSSHVSGIGIGTLLLKVNPKTGRPSAYAWKAGSCWKNNVKFAMARPIDDPDS